MSSRRDVDWVVIGSGFGGSVAALRLAQKGYSVRVLESGARFRDQDFARSTWDTRRYFFAPRLGLREIMQLSPFPDVLIASGAGVGGGSLGYANKLYRARNLFFNDPRWRELADWSVRAPRALGAGQQRVDRRCYRPRRCARLHRLGGDQLQQSTPIPTRTSSW